MKSFFLLLAGISAFGFAAAQDQDTAYLDLMKRYHKTSPRTRNAPLLYDVRKPQDFRIAMPDRPASVPAFPEAKLLSVLANGNSVYALPQDHMPCIIPDMKQFNMPTVQAYAYNPPAPIPNPVRPKMRTK